MLLAPLCSVVCENSCASWQRAGWFLLCCSLPLCLSAATSPPLPSPLYVATLDGRLTALDASGIPRWSFASGPPLLASAAAAGLPPVFPGSDGQLYSLSASAGQGVRRLAVSAQALVAASPAATHDGGLVLGERRSSAFVLDGASGALLRSFGLNGEESEAEALALWGERKADAGVLFLGRVDYTVRSVEAVTGAERWNVSFSELRLLSPPSSASEPAALRSLAPVFDHVQLPPNWEKALASPPVSLFRTTAGGAVAPLALSPPSPAAVTARRPGMTEAAGGEHILVGAHASGLFALPPPSGPSPGLGGEGLAALPAAESGALALRGSTGEWEARLLPLPLSSDFGLDFDWLPSLPPPDAPAPPPTPQPGSHPRRASRGTEAASATAAAAGTALLARRLARPPPPKPPRRRRRGRGKADPPDLSCLPDPAAAAEPLLPAPPATPSPLRVGRLTVGPAILGLGSCGTVVFEGSLDGRPVAVKRLLSHFHGLAKKELAALIRADAHHGVLRCFALEEDDNFVYVALERCACTLAHLLEPSIGAEQQPGQPMAALVVPSVQPFTPDGRPSPALWCIMRDLAAGLAALHSQGVIHRDMKPQNVLLTPQGRAKLSDFGVSRSLEPGEASVFDATGGGGTSGWRAPEALAGGRQGRGVDVWALGCLLFYCLTGGAHPFGERHARDGAVSAGAPAELARLGGMPEAQDLLARLSSSALDGAELLLVCRRRCCGRTLGSGPPPPRCWRTPSGGPRRPSWASWWTCLTGWSWRTGSRRAQRCGSLSVALGGCRLDSTRIQSQVALAKAGDRTGACWPSWRRSPPARWASPGTPSCTRGSPTTWAATAGAPFCSAAPHPSLRPRCQVQPVQRARPAARGAQQARALARAASRRARRAGPAAHSLLGLFLRPLSGLAALHAPLRGTALCVGAAAGALLPQGRRRRGGAVVLRAAAAG